MRRAVLGLVLGAVATAGVAGTAAAPAAAMPVGAEPMGGGAGAAAGTQTVRIGFSSYTPGAVTVLAGDTVTWVNDSVRAHTVTTDDGSADSGRLAMGARYARRLDRAALLPYHCTLHAGMNGTVAVERVLLVAPGQAAAPGRAFPLAGRAAAEPGTEVRLQAETGSGYTDAGRAVVQADGSFRGLVTPATSTRYRALAGDASSPAVTLRVTDHRIGFGVARRPGGIVAITARVTPADVGAPVVLQLYLPERFGWWPVRSGRLDRSSRVRLRVRLHRRVAARVLLTLPDRATPLAVSAVRWIGRRAAPAGR